jgi:hypothetical protein
MLKQRPARRLKLAKVVESQKVSRDKGTEFGAKLLLNAVLRALLLGYVSITTSSNPHTSFTSHKTVPPSQGHSIPHIKLDLLLQRTQSIRNP